MSAASQTSLRAIWDDIAAAIKACEAASRVSEETHTHTEASLATKAETLQKIHANLTAERQALISSFASRRAAGVSPADEDEFWLRLADLDTHTHTLTQQLDDTKLHMYFPATRGYTYRFAAPGLYVGIGDFWLGHLSGKLSVEAVPGRGQLWAQSHTHTHTHPHAAGTVPPGIAVRASHISVALHIDDLGLRGDSIPSTLRNIREIELTLELNFYAPMAFYTPPRKLEAAAGDAPAAGTKSSIFSWGSSKDKAPAAAPASAAEVAAPTRAQHPINALTKCVWRVLEKDFKFEVTKLDYKTKGTLSVPNSLLKMLINSLVPQHLKAAIVGAVPPEVGMLLALHADHHLNLSGEVVLASLSLDALKAPLEAALDVGATAAGPPSAAPDAASGLKAALRSSLSRAKSMHGMSSSAPPTSSEASPNPAALAAQAIGLSPLQAREWVNAQIAATAGRSGVSIYRSPLDLLRFARQHNPRSRHRRAQRAAMPGVAHSRDADRVPSSDTNADFKSTADLQAAAEAGRQDKDWAHLVLQFQRLIDEHSQLQLVALLEQASKSASKQEQKRMTVAAQTRTVLAHVDAAQLFAAVEALYTKPVHLQVSVHDFLLRIHAETLVGMSKAMMMRGIRLKQDAIVKAGDTVAKASIDASGRSRDTSSTPALPPIAHPRTASRAEAGLRTPSTKAMVGAVTSAASSMTTMFRRNGAKTQSSDLTALASAYDASEPPGTAAIEAGTPATPLSSAQVTPSSPSASSPAVQPTSSLSASEIAAAAAASQQAAAAAASLSNQVDQIHQWARNSVDSVRVLHSFVTRITTSIGGWIMGGERGRVSMAVRQLQVESAPGVMLPMTMTEGFFPPGATVTALESRDERSDALGWSAVGARTARREGSVGAPAPEAGRGTFSVMIAWPKVDEQTSAAAGRDGDGALHTIDESAEQQGAAATATATLELTPTVGSAASDAQDAAPDIGITTPVRSRAGSRDTAPSRPRILSDASGTSAPRPLAAAPQQRVTVPVLTPDDVEVMATVRIHRAWMGLRIDEAALLGMVTRRAEAMAAGLVPGSRGFPPLHALELSFRPAVFGSSYSAQGLDPASLARLSAQRSDAALSSGEIIKPPAWPYVLGVETPEWTRMCLEVVAVEAFGDIPVLARHLSVWMRSVWSAAAAETGPVAEGGRSVSASIALDSPSGPADSTVATGRKVSRTGGSFSTASASFAAAADAAVEAAMQQDAALAAKPLSAAARSSRSASTVVVDGPPLHRASLSSSSLTALVDRPRAPSAASTSTAAPGTAKSMRVAQAQEVLQSASQTITTKMRRYLHNEHLHVAMNLFLSVLSVPAPPLVGLLEESVLMETGSISAAEQAAAKSMDPAVRDIAGIDDPSRSSHPGADVDGAETAGQGMRKVLAITLSSKHALQPSMIPAPGSALLAAPPRSRATSTAPAGAPPVASKTGTMEATAPAATDVVVTEPAATNAAAPAVAPAPPPRRASLTGASSAKSSAPVLSAPAFVVDVQLAFLTLLDDVAALQSALSATDAASAQLSQERSNSL